MEKTQTESNPVKNQWNLFLKTTSIRGLKRIDENKGCIKYFWLLFVISCLSLLIWQIYMVIQNYITLKDVKVTRIRQLIYERAPFPSISICWPNNYRDNISDILANNSVRNPGHYLDRIREKSKTLPPEWSSIFLLHTLDNNKAFRGQIPSHLLEEIVTGFLENSIAITLEYRNRPFEITQVNTYPLKKYFNYSVGEGFTSPKLNIKTFSHSRYNLCYTLTFNYNEQQIKDLETVTLLLFSKPHKFKTTSKDNHAFAIDSIANTNNIALGLHERDISAENSMVEAGILLNTGRLNNIVFSPSMYKTLDCRNDYLDYGYSGKLKYTRPDCVYLFLETLNREHCNCTLDHFLFRHKKSCDYLDWNNFYQSFVTIFECDEKISALAKKLNAGGNICMQPMCQHINYKTFVQRGDMAVMDYQWYWFWKLIDETMGRESGYFNPSNNTNFSDNTMIDYSLAMKHIALVKIHRDSNGLTVYEEERMTSFSNMFSTVGGALSLYMGITITLLAEFIEFVYRLVRNLLTRRDNRVESISI